MDEQLRRAERAAAAGDEEAAASFKKLERRGGIFRRDHPAPFEILSEAEDAQADYDDMWWHGNTGRKCGLWGGSSSGWCYWDVDFKTAVFKPHSFWGHLWGGHNSKRKTIRTHRDGSRKNYRLRAE